jgi:hypothetical protein
MRRFATTIMLGALMACGSGSSDFCQQAISVVQSEDAKIKGCGDSASEEAADSELTADITTAQNDEQSCESGLKSCTSADMSVLSSFLSCEKSVVASIQCDWFTEADAGSDPSFQQYETSAKGCSDMLNNVSAACQGE